MRFGQKFRLLGSVLAACICLATPSTADAVIVFAAASLKDALDVIVRDFEQETGHDVTLSYAGSSALARQIEYGAPADLFISASTDWMDHVEAVGAIDGQTRTDLVSNRLALIGPAEKGEPITIDGRLDLAGVLDGGRLAVALTDAVPAGIYAKAALQTLGLWQQAKPLLAETDNVRAAMALVALGAAPFGIVYASDAMAEKRVSIRGMFPPETHPRIVYPAAITASSRSAAAPLLLDYLRTTTADEAFEQHGFILIEN